jgi:uncharacterized protein (TIGR03086 family)
VSEVAERYDRVAGALSARVSAVRADAWDNPSPCEGWVARDVVRHLVEWVPSFFFSTWDIDPLHIPSVDDDPVGAWFALDSTLQVAVNDPAVVDAVRDTRMGKATFGATLDQIVTPDILIHTWDLARATGLDETLDPVEVHRMAEGMEPLDEMLRTSGHYGPRVAAAEDADEQTRLLAFLGRRP